jgi:superfamily II DNA or RNA helicase/HKD family nuclease
MTGIEDMQEFQDVPRLFISPDQERSLLGLIKSELARSDAAWFASAFYSPGVTNLLIADFERFVEKGGTLRILLSTMGNITKPEYFAHMQTFLPGAGLRVFHPPGIPFDEDPPNFHVKAYLFRHGDGAGAMLIGSSNLSEAGFLRNIEWNYFSPGEANRPSENDAPFAVALRAFETYWCDQAVDVTEDFLTAYRRRWQRQHTAPGGTPVTEGIFDERRPYADLLQVKVLPNVPQREALESLTRLRSEGVGKLAVVAATGIGKTYLAAFDFHQSGFGKILFIAHRENILRRAKESFGRVMGKPDFGTVLGGGNGRRPEDAAVFAMIQTLSRENHLRDFAPDAFDYIVVDEFHHSEAASYRKVLDHFRPRFFLGLTATPERMDGRDVLALCDYNVAYEVRMMEAVDRGWLSPFQYFAVYDETDYDRIAWRGTRYDEEELDRALSKDTRTAILAHNLRKYLPSSGKIKALAFCNTIAHARYTAEHLRRDHGIAAIFLTGDSEERERAEVIRRLRDESDPLEVVCTVDIFNEGIDIPELTHVLFLRPTQSFTVFLQQLGRGLRRAPGKNFLVAIDFVGNFQKVHVAPLALMGFTSVEQFSEACRQNPWLGIDERLPEGCYLNAELDVRRIWDEEIRRIVQGGLSREERLKALYLEIRGDLGESSPTLFDFLGNPHDVDPYLFIRCFSGWLRAKLYCDGDLPENEKRLLDTPGEVLLKHIETDLNPVKSYKMVVLRTLLEMSGTVWQIEAIARGFRDYFLAHPENRHDYEDLAKAADPEAFPLSRVATKLKSMPLNFLSNTEKDPFILDREGGVFRLKDEYHPFWNDADFRELLRERVEFTLVRYFQRRGRDAHSPVAT